MSRQENRQERVYRMARKGENIYKRKDGRWEARYKKGRKENGKIIYGSIYGKTYGEVKEKAILLKAKYAVNDKRAISPYIGNLEDWFHFWLEDNVRGQVKETTYSNYKRISEKYILPLLGSLSLMKIRKKNIDLFILNLQNKELSAGSINNIFNLLKKCLDDAWKQGYILENCCERIVLPRKRQKEIQVLSLNQQKKLEFYAFQEKNCSPIILSLYSGMRIGEISGLSWNDVDFENNLIFVRRTVSRIINEDSNGPKTKVILGTPKSTNSLRTIPMANNLKRYLEKKQALSTSSYVVSNKEGLMEPRTISNHFKKVNIAANIPIINFHTLRHTFATRCLENGMDVASLSRILGHQSTKMTLDTYTGSLMETRRKGIEKIDKLLEM